MVESVVEDFPSFHIGSIFERKDREIAVGSVMEGGLVVVEFDSVYAVIVDPYRKGGDYAKKLGYEFQGDFAIRYSKLPQYIKDLYQLGDSNPPNEVLTAMAVRKPSSMLMDVEIIAETGFVDPRRVSNEVFLALGPDQWANNFGNKAFVRFPVKPDFVDRIPSHMVSWETDGPYAQIFTFKGHTPSYKFQKKLERAMQKKYPDLLPIVAITSANIHGEPEIVDPNKALSFCESSPDICRVLLHGQGVRRKGSYPIFLAGKDGFSLLRAGNIPEEVLFQMYRDLPMVLDTYKTARLPVWDPNAIHSDGRTLSKCFSNLHGASPPDFRKVFDYLTEGLTTKQAEQVEKDLRPN